MREAFVLVGVALLAGCASSPPIRFYTLNAVAREAKPAGASQPIRVTRVKLPGEIDRVELVQRVDANRVQLAEQDRWAAPLEELIRRTLSTDLQAAATSGDTPALLSVDIEELIADAKCVVTLRAAWELKTSAAAGQTTHGYESIQVPAPAECNVGVLPGAMSEALAELSERILRSVSR